MNLDYTFCCTLYIPYTPLQHLFSYFSIDVLQYPQVLTS